MKRIDMTSKLEPDSEHTWAVIPMTVLGYSMFQLSGKLHVQWFKTKGAAENEACRYGKGECVVARLWS